MKKLNLLIKSIRVVGAIMVIALYLCILGIALRYSYGQLIEITGGDPIKKLEWANPEKKQVSNKCKR